MLTLYNVQINHAVFLARSFGWQMPMAKCSKKSCTAISSCNTSKLLRVSNAAYHLRNSTVWCTNNYKSISTGCTKTKQTLAARQWLLDRTEQRLPPNASVQYQSEGCHYTESKGCYLPCSPVDLVVQQSRKIGNRTLVNQNNTSGPLSVLQKG